MATTILTIEMQNRTCSTSVYCWVVGYAIDNNNQLMMLSSDGQTPYYPESPPSDQTAVPLGQDCAIPFGLPGTSIYLRVPHLAGCRIYFCIDAKLLFFLNPGPAIVEPSVTNPADPNINMNWGFSELAFNDNEAFANISMVDFVSIPVSLTLTTTTGNTNHVSGLALNGLRNISAALKAQSAMDGQPWSNLIVTDSNGNLLRVLSPNNGTVLNPSMFDGYFDSYVNQVWQQYSHTRLAVNTQAQWGVLSGSVVGDALVIDGIPFNKPSAGDIFSCSDGPFSNGSPEKLCIIPRLAAAFNRSTLLTSFETPAPVGVPFYKTSVTNHYARIVHEQLLDGKGYAFPYDDVAADGDTSNEAGAVYDSNPKLLTFAVGGNGAYVIPTADGG